MLTAGRRPGGLEAPLEAKSQCQKSGIFLRALEEKLNSRGVSRRDLAFKTTTAQTEPSQGWSVGPRGHGAAHGMCPITLEGTWMPQPTQDMVFMTSSNFCCVKHKLFVALPEHCWGCPKIPFLEVCGAWPVAIHSNGKSGKQRESLAGDGAGHGRDPMAVISPCCAMALGDPVVACAPLGEDRADECITPVNGCS